MLFDDKTVTLVDTHEYVYGVQKLKCFNIARVIQQQHMANIDFTVSCFDVACHQTDGMMTLCGLKLLIIA